MIKLVLPVVVVFLLSGFLYFRFFNTSKNSKSVTLPLGVNQQAPSPSPVPANLDQESRFKLLEEATLALKDQIKGLGGSKDVEARLKTLETLITDLQQRLARLEQTPPPPLSQSPTQTTTKSPTIYIPLGSGGSTSDQNWLTIDTYEIGLDPANYPGYASMQFEVNMRLTQKVGTAYARLFNSSDNSAISSSEVSTTSDKFVLLTSSGFKLPSGSKTYKVQLKSSTSTEVQLQNARLRVNF